ncbi:MAG: tetratricopeptide repeat protein [Pseudomonadota bacterium]
MHNAPRLRHFLFGALLAFGTAHADITLDAQIVSDEKERLIGYVTAIAAGDNGGLYTADSRDGLLVHFAADGRSAVALAGKEQAFSSSRVRGLVRLGSDRFAVANEGDGKVAIIDGKGAVILKFGDSGNAEGRLSAPAGLAWSQNRRLYVADKGANRISVFGPDGVYIRTLGGQEGARLDTPEQVYVDHRERVYVFERRNRGTLSVFAHDGALLHRTDAGTLGKEAKTSLRLTTLAVDPATGYVYLGDSENGRIYMYDWESGALQSGFGTRGRQRGQFAEISALELLADGRLAVADNENKKIEIYRLPPSDRTPLPRLHLPTITQAGNLTLECDLAHHAADGKHWCLSRRTGGALRDGGGNTLLTLQDTLDKPLAASFGSDRIALIDDTKLKIFAPDGSLLFTSGDNRAPASDPFGAGGSQFDASTDGKFDRPADVYLRGDRIYVIDSSNRRLQIFSHDGLYLDKIANPKSRPWLFEEPVTVAVDSRGTLYVGDQELKQVLIFGRNKQLIGQIDGGELPGEKFSEIFDLEVDADDNLYVLCATPNNESTVQVYRNRQLAFTFGARSADASGFAAPVNLTLPPSAQRVVSLYDRERKQLIDFNYQQVPPAVADIAVSGGTQHSELRWGALRSSYITAYRVYGAAVQEGPYRLITEVQEPRAQLEHNGHPHSLYYRIAAVSGFGVEGPASEPVLDLFQAGYGHYQAKAWAEAEAAFRRQHEEYASHAETNKYLGLTLMEQQQYTAARPYFETLAGQPGHEAEGARLLVGAWRAAGDDVAAKGVVDRVLARGTATPELRLLCGELSLVLNDAIGAVQCLEEALKQDGNNVQAHLLMADAYIRLGITEQGQAELALARELAAEDPQVWRRSAQIQQRLGAHAAAIEFYAKTLELAPDDLDSRLALARSHHALGQHDKVRNIALALTGHAETEGDGHYLLGTLALEEKKYGEALLALTKATRAAPHNAAAWLALADAYVPMKQEQMIPAALEKAMQADANSFDAAWRLGQYQHQHGQYAAAAAPLARAVALQPDNYDANYLLADALLHQGELKEAFQHASEAARLAPARVEPLALLGAVSARQGKNGAAINYLKQALAKQANDLGLLLQLGALYVDNNMFDQARTTLDKAALVDATRADPHVLLGKLYMKRRLFDEAIAALDKAVTINPSDDNRLLLDTAYAEKNKALEFKSNAPQIVLKDLQLQPVFTAAYKQYANAPIGTIRVHNTSGIDYGNLKLTFDIKGYMDFPTSKEIPELKANSIIDVPLHASFNNRVLEIDEDTGVQVEVALKFVRDGRDDAITLTQPMTLYGKNAILWARSNMAGAFVTPRDDTLRDFVRQAINENRPEAGPLNAHLVTAMTLFDVLSAHGIKYVTDPNSPYAKLAADQVDYVQFARETLKLKSGDCDDLSVLLAAALENLGIETAILDVPGHLLLMFNTGLPAADAGLISLQDDLLAIRDGNVWIPVEATMIATSFAEAWTEGARKYHQHLAAKSLKVIPLHQAWEEYQPVTLKQADHRIEAPARERVEPLVQREYNLLLEKSLDRLVRPYRAMLAAGTGNERSLTQIAIIYARNGLYDKAFQAFDELLRKNPDSSAAYNNRGNIYFARGEFDRALQSYSQAELIDGSDAGIKINLAMTHYKLGRLDQAKEKYAEAMALNGEIKSRYGDFGRLLAN